MIAPRANYDDIQSPITININIPQRLAEGLMQFLATLTQQQLDFPEFGHSTDSTQETRSDHGRFQRKPAIRSVDGAGLVAATDAAPESLVELYDRLLSAQDAEKRVRRKTISDNRSFLSKFQAWAENDTRNSGPRVVSVKTLENSQLLAEYARHLRSQESGSSESMCTKALAAVGKLANAALKAGLIRRKADKPSRPAIKRLKPRTEKERRVKAVPVSVEELQAMLAVVDGCRWPQIGKVSASDFWRTCLLSHYCYGFRSQDWFAVRDQWKQGLLWSGIVTETQCPLFEDLHNEHGWAWYLVHKTDTKDEEADRPSDVLIPLSAEMRRLIELFRGLDPERVFPLPQTHRSYDREFSGILKRSGLSDKSREECGKPKIRLSLGQRNVASFRKGSAALWRRHVSPAAASYLLHHSDSESGVAKTTAEHYLQHEDILREITPAIETLPLW